MTDQTTEPSRIESGDEPPGPPEPAPPTMPPPGWRPPRQRLRDRLFRFRSVLAVGLAGLIIGGGAGAGGMALAKDGSDGRPVPGHGRFPGQVGPGYGQWRQLPGPGGQDQQGTSG